MSCSNCNCTPCTCCPPQYPTPAAPIVTTESNPCVIPECPDCPPVIHEELDQFIMPEVDENTPVEVCDTDAWPVGLCVYISDGDLSGILKIVSTNEAASTISVENGGLDINAMPGATFSGDINMLLYGPCEEPVEEDCHVMGVRTSESFTVPQIDGSADIYLNRCVTLKAGQRLHIEGFGCVVVQEVTEERPLASFVGLFESMWDASPGDVIPAGAVVTTAEYCLEWDGATILGAGTKEDPLRAVTPGSGSFLGAVQNKVDVWTVDAAAPVEDPNMVLSISVEAGDQVLFLNQVVVQSPRGRFLIEQTGGSGAAVRFWGVPADEEDGNNEDPGDHSDVTPFHTAAWHEIWSVTATGTLNMKIVTQTGPTGGPQHAIHGRSIIAQRV